VRLAPVLVTVTPVEAAEALRELLDDYGAELERGRDQSTVSIEPIDDLRRGTVIYRVIQASRTIAETHPESSLFLVTEDGSRWRLPPPAL
jgi:hypothetical protein